MICIQESGFENVVYEMVFIFSLLPSITRSVNSLVFSDAKSVSFYITKDNELTDPFTHLPLDKMATIS